MENKDNAMRNHPHSKARLTGLRPSDLTDDLFQAVCRKKGLTLLTWKVVPMDTSSSVHHKLMHESDDVIVGMLAFEIMARNTERERDEKFKVVLKAKGRGRASADAFVNLAKMISEEAAELWRIVGKDPDVGFDRMHEPEVRAAVRAMNKEHPFSSICPEVYHVEINEERDVYFFIMEYLCEENVAHLDSIQHLEGLDSDWDEESVRKTLKDISAFHGAYLDNMDKVFPLLPHLFKDPIRFTGNNPQAYRVVLADAVRRYPEMYPGKGGDVMTKMADNILPVFETLSSTKRALIHHDFNIKNLCIRKNPSPTERFLCAYDWEVMTFCTPLLDVAEFLIWAMTGNDQKWPQQLEYYRTELVRAVPSERQDLVEWIQDKEHFQQIFDYAIFFYAFGRISAFHLLNQVYPMPKFPDVTRALCRYIESIAYKYDFLKDV